MIKYLRLSLFCAVSVAFIGTRLWHLTDSCLVFDEIYSVHAAEHGWTALSTFTALDLVHPPLFYALLKLWTAIGGAGLLWLRLLPALFAITSLIPTALLCRELREACRQWCGLVAVGLMSANGSLLKYSQEVRMYSLLMLLSVTALWLTVRYINRGIRFWWLVVTNILLVWTHYFGWFVVLSGVVAILTVERSRWRRALVLFTAPLIAFAPWVIEIAGVWTRPNLAQNVGWIDHPGLIDLGLFLLTLFEPFYYRVSNADPAANYLISIPLLVIFLAALLIWSLRRQAERTDDIKIMSIFIAVPIAGAFVASWLLPYSVWGTRHLIIAFIPAALLFARIVTSVGPAWIRSGAIALVALLIGLGAIMSVTSPTTAQPSWCAWGDLAEDARTSGALKLYVIEDLAAYHAWFATRHADPPFSIVKLTGVNGSAEDTAYFLPRGFDDVQSMEVDRLDDPTVWVAFRYPTFKDDFSLLGQLAAKGYRVTDTKTIEAAGENVYLVRLER